MKWLLVDECRRLNHENDVLKRALNFYGRRENYPAYYAGAPSEVLKDRGVIARAAVLIHWVRT
jgi:hypothetical protein